MLCCIASIAVSGWMVSRWPRPKLIVGVSSIGIAAAMLFPAFSASWPAMVLLHAGMGLFLGAYLAIDLALMSLVLPDREAEGRDMAILQVATSSSQVLSPVFAATVIATLGYPPLFLLGAATALGAGAVVFCIKSVD